MEAKLEVKIDQTKIKGMTELLMAADALVAPGLSASDKEKCITKIRAAMLTIGENFQEGNLADAVVVTESASGKGLHFYHMDGKPAEFDIDEDVGQLLIACDKALDFINNGPILGAPQKVIDELYEVRVIKLIPKLRAVVENRIMVKYPYGTLVDMTFNARHDLRPEHKYGELERLRVSAYRASYTSEQLAKLIAGVRVGQGDPIPAAEVMEHVSFLMEDLQQVMNLFGWTADDVKLFSRKRISELTEPQTKT